MAEKHFFLGVEAIWASPRMCDLFAQVRRIAQSALPVVLLGESGSGREVIARALHYYSPRRPKPFVDLICGSLPANLIEAELFGYDRRSLTAPHSTRSGLLELAHEGTLFLNEIGSLAPRAEAKLLQTFDASHSLGFVRQSHSNVRIIAATSSPSSAQRLYSALSARKTVELLEIPPLRERPEDIEALACHFLSQQNPELRFASGAMTALYAYLWPGNVRELRNTVLRSALLSKGPLLHADDILFSPAVPGACAGVAGLEPALIRQALADSGGRLQRAADSLGISRHALSRKIRFYGLNTTTLIERISA
ncbi:MAG: sigma 54-interacting transcriptional regulator [Acidobacteriota bacterium]